MSPTTDALVCLQDQGIDDDNNSVGILRRGLGLSNDDGGVGRGRGISNASKVLETTTEAAGDRRRAQGIYDSDGGVQGGI